METLLTAWLDGIESIRVVDDASVSEARRLTRELAIARGFPVERAERLALAASELARNVLRHAMLGRFAVRPIERGAITGLELVTIDAGKGLVDAASALDGAARPQGSLTFGGLRPPSPREKTRLAPLRSASLGVGVKTARTQVDEMDFDVRLGEGTCIRARAFASGVARRREVGIYGRPFVGEPRSGDHALFFRDGASLLVAVCDGLGHGDPAREAAQAALSSIATHRDESPASIVDAAHRDTSKTRGAVLAVARLDEPGGPSSSMTLASVGNITVEVSRHRGTRRFPATSFVLGAPQKGWRAHTETTTIAADEVLVVFSDGVPSRFSLGDRSELLREHPIVIAQRIVEEFGRDTDDVMVLVAR